MHLFRFGNKQKAGGGRVQTMDYQRAGGIRVETVYAAVDGIKLSFSGYG